MSAAVKYLTKKVAEAENEAAKAWRVRRSFLVTVPAAPA